MAVFNKQSSPFRAVDPNMPGYLVIRTEKMLTGGMPGPGSRNARRKLESKI